MAQQQNEAPEDVVKAEITAEIISHKGQAYALVRGAEGLADEILAKDKTKREVEKALDHYKEDMRKIAHSMRAEGITGVHVASSGDGYIEVISTEKRKTVNDKLQMRVQEAHLDDLLVEEKSVTLSGHMYDWFVKQFGEAGGEGIKVDRKVMLKPGGREEIRKRRMDSARSQLEKRVLDELEEGAFNAPAVEPKYR